MIGLSLVTWGKKWDALLTARSSAATLGLMRMAYAAVVLLWAILLGPNLLVWYGERGILPFESISHALSGERLSLFNFLAPTDASVVAVYVSLIIAALGLLMGFGGRIFSAWIFICITSLHHRNSLILNSGDTLMRLLAFYMIFAPADARFSIKRLWNIARGTEEVEHPPQRFVFAQRMMQLQMSIVYITTFWWKSQGSMWTNGTAVYVTSRLEDFQRLPIPYLFEHLWTIKALTWGTLAIEFALGTLIWFKELRYPLVLAGILFHFGLEASMNIPIFQWVMMVGLLSFIEADDLERALQRLQGVLRNRWGAPMHVYFDGACVFCTRSANVVRAMDLLGRLNFVDFRDTAQLPKGFDKQRAEKELVLQTRSGVWLGGFDAFRWMAWRMPATWLLAPFLYVPPIPIIGRWVYRWVASHRYLIMGRSCSIDGSHEAPSCKI